MHKEWQETAFLGIFATMLHTIIIFLPLFICSLLTLDLVLMKKYRAQRWLLAWAATASILYFCHALHFSGSPHFIPWRHAAYAMCNLAVYPLYLIYISGLCEHTPISASVRKLTLCLLPAALGGGILIALFSVMPQTGVAAFMQDYLVAGSMKTLTGIAAAAAWTDLCCKIAFTLEVVCTVVLGSRMLRRYDDELCLYYADTEGYALTGIRRLLYLLGATAFVSVAVNILGRHTFAGNDSALAIASLLFSMLLYAIGFVGRHTPCVDIPENDKIPDETAVFSLELSSIMDNFRTLMESEQTYLQTDLKLQDVARRLGTNRTYLLHAIRVETGMTFSEYVNRSRIAYAQKLMAEHPDWEKAQVAAMSGYASLSSFYRNWNMFGKG